LDTKTKHSNPRDSAGNIANTFGLATFNLGNRRYLGGKSKLLGFIDSEIQALINRSPQSVFDVFSGTGVVAEFYASKGSKVIANDLLLHNYYGLQTFLGSQSLDLHKLAEKIVHLQNVKSKANYFSKNFGGNYFSLKNSKFIGSVREEIDLISESPREKAALITSLIYASDRVANTVGHYDAFHRGSDNTNEVLLKMPNVTDYGYLKNEVFQFDSLNLAPRVSAEIAYLDPPYNSRQYSDSYHLLENLASWNKPEVFGIAKKFDRTALKSEFCGARAPQVFDNLIQSLEANLIMVSYSNNSKSLNLRSNAAIPDEAIIKSLKARGKVFIREIDYGVFTTGRTSKTGHKERLFICKVKK
jgi:adenine-specific DNA-methyltransferase